MTLKLITYNIDGLPVSLDLIDLPWLLRPIAWIYRLFKKTTVITINDDDSKDKNIRLISENLYQSNADIIAVQEDFNYHEELMSELNEDYDCGKHTGGFSLSNLFSVTELLSYFPLPRFKADGLNLITKKGRVVVNSETIVSWKKSNGYISHANDLLTHKGFRLYELTIDNEADIDVYNVHMDADFYDKDLCPDVEADIKARRMQLQQLTNFILKRHRDGIHRPIIIMGDTNSSQSYSWDVENIREYLIHPFLEEPYLDIQESIPFGTDDVDRIFYINNSEAPYCISDSYCYYTNTVNLSDHKPFTALFSLEKWMK